MKATSADGVAIALKIGSEIICKASVGVAPAVGAKVGGESTWSARCIREAQPVSFSHTGEKAGTSYSAILVPLLHAGRAIGCCAAFAERADAFTPEHLRALLAIAATAVRGVTPEPQQPPASTEKIPDPRPSRTVSNEHLQEIEAELAAFAEAEKHRLRVAKVRKWALATVLVLATGASCFPDQLRDWAQPILQTIHSSGQSLPIRASERRRPTGAVAAQYRAGN